ncbi:MAG: peptide ABC transporter substrate-binding protein [Dehalococcoidia bacterium]
MPLTQTRWPIFAALVVGIAAVAVFWYFVLSNPKGEAVPASGGRYVEGVTRAAEQINPLFAQSNPTDADLASLIFSGLVRLGADGLPQPDLAERWEITGNGRNYVFHLRDGVAWHDGADLTADDVVFTFGAIADPEFRGDPVLAQLMQGVVIRARDPLTVEFRLEQAYAPFLAYLNVGILPQHLLDGLDADGLANTPFNADPVGTGPYTFAGRTSDGVRLEANPTYYLGPPRISRLDFRVYPDGDALAAALRDGAADGALLDPATPRAQLDVLGGEEGFSLHRLTSMSFNAAYLNIDSPIFADPTVRRALQRAIDVTALIVALSPGGEGTPAGIPPGSWAYTPVEVPSFSPGQAASALEQAGWPRGQDGVRNRGGLRLAFTLSTTNDPLRVAIAEEIARQWRAVGASVTVQPLDAGTYIDEHLLPRRFEAALVLVDPGPDPDPYPFWHSSQIAPPGRNLAKLFDTSIDDMLERARQTTEVDRRRELYAEFQDAFVAAVPALPLYAPGYTYAQSPRVQGFADALLITASSRFASVREWYVRTRVED